MLLNQTFFFVGYGLRDPNFRQIYSRIARMLRDAHRPAFATTFGAAGDAGQHLAEQWKNKQLHLIRIPGADPTEQEQQFLRFLDRLADRVTTANASRLFLAPDVEAAPVLHPLREQLLAAVGDEIPRLCREDLSAPHLHHLATVLGFLADHGWQPRGHGVDLGELWERLAQQTADSAVRKRLLIAALKSAGRFDDVRRLQEQLRQIEATDGPPPGAGGDGNGMAHGGPGR